MYIAPACAGGRATPVSYTHLTNIAQPLVLSFVSDYFATFSSHFSMNSMVNMEMQSVVYKASRYGKGEAAYLNCPMNEEEYHAFREALIHAETAEVHGFENGKVFEGCMPIEVMAARGEDTMRFGPLKPVGLPLPGTDKEPYAVVQLRQDNEEGTQYNIVGFQTHLKWGEQRRVFGMIPGLKNAEFVRYGVMHRNTYIDSPDLLNATLEARKRQEIGRAHV